jgi:aminoglycoside phosphotransferase (APT) family kinase protein
MSMRTPRLDPVELARRLGARTGTRLVVEEPCAGGEVGAAYVRWPDGRRGVLTMSTPRSPALVAVARAAGLPVARYELTEQLDGAFVVVQELLPGAPPATVDRPLVDAMIALNRRMAGLLADRPHIPAVRLYLRDSGPGFCLHEPLAGYDRRTTRLLAWVREVGAEHDTADGADLVHMDYHPGNVLVSEGRISGLVDWDGAGRGDRHLDLVTLRFDLALRAPHLGAYLDDLLAHAVPRDRLRAYWAHMGLRLVDWAIRHHGPADVDRWLATAERGARELS